MAGAQTCSDRSLKDSFGYTVTGMITKTLVPSSRDRSLPPAELSSMGGSVTTLRSLNDNGTPLHNDAGSGTYSMKSDCTGSFTIAVGPPGQQIDLNLDIVLDDSYELCGVVTTANVVLVCGVASKFL